MQFLFTMAFFFARLFRCRVWCHLTFTVLGNGLLCEFSICKFWHSLSVCLTILMSQFQHRWLCSGCIWHLFNRFVCFVLFFVFCWLKSFSIFVATFPLAFFCVGCQQGGFQDYVSMHQAAVFWHLSYHAVFINFLSSDDVIWLAAGSILTESGVFAGILFILLNHSSNIWECISIHRKSQNSIFLRSKKSASADKWKEQLKWESTPATVRFYRCVWTVRMDEKNIASVKQLWRTIVDAPWVIRRDISVCWHRDWVWEWKRTQRRAYDLIKRCESKSTFDTRHKLR